MTETSKLGVFGFGTAHLYGGASRRAALSLVHAAWDAGVTWFDTAPLYGHGASEAILGDALQGRRSEATIVSKVGIDPVNITLPYRLHAQAARLAGKLPGLKRLIAPPPPLSPRFHQFAPDAVRASVERSLKALRTDYLDMLLLHECTPGEAESLLDTLNALKQQGKIKAFGTATSFDETVQIAARRSADFDAFQFAFNLDGPPARGQPLIVHSVLGPRVKQLEQALAGDAAARARASALGIDPDQPDLARRLLAGAARGADVRAVLFSTSKPERVAALAGAGTLSAAEAEAGLAFARWRPENELQAPA